jgi:hypothetical protein
MDMAQSVGEGATLSPVSAWFILRDFNTLYVLHIYTIDISAYINMID